MSKNKFRALIEGNTGFFYGGYYAEGDTEYIVCSPFLLAKAIPGTVGQCSDKEDRNGCEIYEGDILSATGCFCEIGIVKFGKYKQSDMSNDYECANQGFYVDITKRTELYRHDLHYWASMCEVIGNIHDNPELLDETSIAITPEENK